MYRVSKCLRLVSMQVSIGRVGEPTAGETHDATAQRDGGEGRDAKVSMGSKVSIEYV